MSQSASHKTVSASKLVATNNEVSEEDMAAFHPTIRNIVFAPNHFAALGLEPRADYTNAEIQEAYKRKLAELNALVDET